MDNRKAGARTPLLDEPDEDQRQAQAERELQEALQAVVESDMSQMTESDCYEIPPMDTDSLYVPTPLSNANAAPSDSNAAFSGTCSNPPQMTMEQYCNPRPPTAASGQTGGGHWSKPPAAVPTSPAKRLPRARGKDLSMFAQPKPIPGERKRTVPDKPKAPVRRLKQPPPKEGPQPSVVPKPSTSVPCTPTKSIPGDRLKFRSLSTNREVTFRGSEDPCDQIGPSFERDNDLPPDVHAKIRFIVVTDYEVFSNHYAKQVCQEVKVEKKGGCVDPLARIKLRVERKHELSCKP